MMKNVKKNTITKINEVFSSNFLKMLEIIYKDTYGDTRKWYAVTRKNIDEYRDILFGEKKAKDDAVVICATCDNGDRAVLIKEFRMPINSFIYSLPAGIVENDEEIFSAAVREMKEETGLDLIVDIDRSKSLLYPSVGLTDESLSIVYGSASGNTEDVSLEPSEIIEVVKLDKEEAKKLLKSSEKLDIKAWYFLKEFVNDCI